MMRILAVLLVVCLTASLTAQTFERPIKRRPPLASETKADWFPVESQAPKEGWGMVSGRIIWEGELPDAKTHAIARDQTAFGVRLPDESLLVNKENRGIANVLVIATTRSDRVHESFAKIADKPAVQFAKEGQFLPRVVILQPGQLLQFSNLHPVPTNYRIDPLKNEPTNRLVPPGTMIEWQPKEEEPAFIMTQSNVHPWQQGWLWIRKSPYVTVTQGDGSFKIANLPAGDVLLTGFHEKTGWREIRVRSKGEESRWGKVVDGEELKLEAVWPAEYFRE